MNLVTLMRAAVGLLIAAAACGAYAQGTAQILADRWVQAYNKHDREALSALYTEDARLMIHGSATISGRENIEKYWASDFADRDPLTLMTVTHAVTGVDTILVHGDYKVVSREDGRQLGFGRFAHLWTNERGEWLLERDLWNQPFEPYDATVTGEHIQDLTERWAQAYNRHDRDALAAVYTEDARLMMHGGPAVKGRDAIGAFWAEDFKEDNPLTVLTVTHAVDGDDMILVHGDYDVVNRDDGTTVGAGRFAHIWFLQDGEWRLDRDLWHQRFEPFLLR